MREDKKAGFAAIFGEVPRNGGRLGGQATASDLL